jgi:hypothetical protein
MPAINAFVNANSLGDLRQALESNPILLADPRVEAIFEQNIRQVKEQDQDFAQKLVFCLGLLQDARANGIPTAFAHLEDALKQAQAGESAPPGGLPADFVPRVLQGLKGSAQDKMELFNWLAELAEQAPPPERKLIEQVQQALFSPDPTAMLADLDEPQRAIWKQILQGLGDAK